MKCNIATKYNTIDEIEVDFEELINILIGSIEYKYNVDVNEDFTFTMNGTFNGMKLDEVEYLLNDLIELEELLKVIGHLNVKGGKVKLDIDYIREIEKWTDISFKL